MGEVKEVIMEKTGNIQHRASNEVAIGEMNMKGIPYRTLNIEQPKFRRWGLLLRGRGR
jgi:hypothetical protein